MRNYIILNLSEAKLQHNIMHLNLIVYPPDIARHEWQVG